MVCHVQNQVVKLNIFFNVFVSYVFFASLFHQYYQLVKSSYYHIKYYVSVILYIFDVILQN